MFKKISYRLFCCLLLAALLLVFLPNCVSADDTWDGSSASTAWTGSGTSNDPYVIDTGAELKGFANQVEAGTYYSGTYFRLDDNINLNNHAWVPIGGHSSLSSYIPTGDYFSGFFDGNNKTVSGLSITTSTANYGGYALFGYVNGGVIGNLNVSGTISLSNSGNYAGGLVGYLNGNVYNCHNDVDVTANNYNGVGGIAGATETENSTAHLVIKYCSNTGDISGGSRVGGISGATYGYGTHSDSIVVDQCFNTGEVYCACTGSKNWNGGIVGYNAGYINNCYNQGTFDNPSNPYRCYQGGIAGILNGNTGYGPISGMSNVYSTATFAEPTSYAKYLWASADSNSAVNITNGFYIATDGTATVTQPTTGYGTCTEVLAVSSGQLAGTAYLADNTTVISWLNSAVTATGAAGNKFSYNENFTYPVLNWQLENNFKVTDLGSSAPGTNISDTDMSGAVYLDGENGDDENGGTSKTDAVQTFSAALDLLDDEEFTVKTIYICGQVSISSSETWDLSSIAGAKAMRSCAYGGDLVEVLSGGTLTLQNITIDGNDDNITPAGGSLVLVDEGTVSIGSGAYLYNNYANNGGGVRLIDGSATMSGGTITGNTAAKNGGAVCIDGGSFTLNGGVITGNTANLHGGGVYRPNGGYTYSSGTITGNTPENVYPTS